MKNNKIFLYNGNIGHKRNLIQYAMKIALMTVSDSLVLAKGTFKYLSFYHKADFNNENKHHTSMLDGVWGQI